MKNKSNAEVQKFLWVSALGQLYKFWLCQG